MNEVRKALEWYQEQAEAAARHSIQVNTNALMAIIQALALDAGNRAKMALGTAGCGLSDPTYRDCPNMKEVGGGMEGERYRCDVCGKGYFLDYEDMK